MKENKNLVIIDADSLVYYVGYKTKLLKLRSIGIHELDSFIKDILKATRSNKYIGYFAKAGARNFRYDIAVTKPYKGNRKKEKEDWYIFWEPILKERMKTYWNFIDVDKIEADDACVIAANHYRGKFNKVTIASPDKDLYQAPDLHFYDYVKGTEVFVEKATAEQIFATSILTGDSADNIPGIDGVGKVAANKAILEMLDEMKKDSSFSLIEHVILYYYKWHKITVKEKQLKKLEAEYLKQYKIENDIKAISAKKKSEALKDFKPEYKNIKTDKEIRALFKEQYDLLYLLATKKEGKKYGFTLSKPIKCDKIDWEEVIEYENELEEIDYETDDIDLDVLEDL